MKEEKIKGKGRESYGGGGNTLQYYNVGRKELVSNGNDDRREVIQPQLHH